MLDTVLGAKDTAVNKEDKKSLPSFSLYVPLETSNNQDEVRNMLKCKLLSRAPLLANSMD